MTLQFSCSEHLQKMLDALAKYKSAGETFPIPADDRELYDLLMETYQQSMIAFKAAEEFNQRGFESKPSFGKGSVESEKSP